MSKVLHLVSFDVPFPANYGGVIDVYYKIKSLKSKGIDVILHAYQYGRDTSKKLEELCLEVNYYERKLSPRKLLSSLPFIVITRNSESLYERLQKDEYPILFEGLHTTYWVSEGNLDKERLFLRNHNVESDYYDALASKESNPFKKKYFQNEAKKLKVYESRIVSNFQEVFTISKGDTNYFNETYSQGVLVSAFHQSENVDLPEGQGEFCFYHGNLGVGENDQAALFLVEKVFNSLDEKLIIAGSNPSKTLEKSCEGKSNINLISDLSSEEMEEMIKKAHINVLPTFQATGIKLKLLVSLFKGRFTIVNEPMVRETGLEEICTIAKDEEEFKTSIRNLMKSQWNKADVHSHREHVLSPFSNDCNIVVLISTIFKA